MNLFLKTSPLAAFDALGVSECAERAQPVARSLRCHNLFGGGSSRTATTTADNRVGASDQANVLQEGSIQGTDQAIIGSTVTTADPEVLKRALEAYVQIDTGFQKTLSDILENAERNTTAQQQLSSNLFETLSKQLADLSESKQTEGESERNKIILYIVAIIGLVIVAVFWKRR